MVNIRRLQFDLNLPPFNIDSNRHYRIILHQFQQQKPLRQAVMILLKLLRSN